MSAVEAAIPLFRQPRVAVIGERAVLIDDLVVEDAAVVALVAARAAAGEDTAVVAREALEIGARVLDRERAAAQTDVVRVEFERASREVETQFADQARGVAEVFGRKLDELFAADSGTLARSLEKHFSDESSGAVQHRVKAVVEEVLVRSREDLLKQFSSADGLLSDFKRGVTDSVRQASERSDQNVRMLLARLTELSSEVEKLRAEKSTAAEVAQEAERGTAKGRTFESAVAEAVDQIALARGDDSDWVGDLGGIGSRKGDVVVGVEGASGPPRGRIVFEAKNRQLSKKGALAELEESLVTRDAQYAVLVVPSEGQLPARTQQLREFGGNKLFVVHDPEDEPLALEVAYGLARCRVLMARGGAETLDPVQLAGEVEKAVVALEDVRRVKGQLTTATNSIESAKSILDIMAIAVRDHLTRLDELLAGAESDRLS